MESPLENKRGGSAGTAQTAAMSMVPDTLTPVDTLR